jgi:DNA-directed RNA polymerase specialized sigma24 family protein
VWPIDFEELERRVVHRDRAAFTTLERAYTNIVNTFAVTKLGDQRAAREITERTFTRAWEIIDRYPWRDFSFHVWILRIAREEIDERQGGADDGYRR